MTNVNNILESIFYDPKIGLMSFEKFRMKVKDLYPEIKTKTIKQFYENQEINQIAKKPIIDKTKEYKINGPELSFQVDLMFVPKTVKTKEAQIKKANEEGLFPKNLFYVFLLCVDILSRKAYIYPLPDKTASSVITGYTQFLSDLKQDTEALEDTENYFNRFKPFSIIADDGFNFKQFTKLNESLDILLDTSTAKDDHIVQGNRLGIIDRLVRTIKNLLMKYIYATSGKQYSVKQIIQNIVENYNDTPHRSLNNVTPNQVFENKEARMMIYNENKNHNENIDHNNNLQIGDTVRILNRREAFGKEKPQFSKEIYVIDEQIGHKYIVKDNDNNKLNRKLKSNEIQKIDTKQIKNKNPINIEKEIQQNKTTIRTEQQLKQLDINAVNIIEGKRERKPNKKYADI